tara:strand:+ start:486 stop:1409 length:924 start_codon:yes stop_codon:yes gene_type:complete
MFVSLVISFKNEEKNLNELIKRCVKVIEKNDQYEIIFVDDASTDKSLEVLLNHRKENKNIKIITTSRTFGVSPCVLAGFKKAKGDVIIYMDSDLQDPPEIIDELINKHKEGYEVVHTVRKKRFGESLYKIFLTKIAYKLINLFSDIELLENAGDFKLISKNALHEILKIQDVDPYLRGLSVWVGYKQSYVSYERQPRLFGKSKFTFLNNLNPYKEFIRGITSFSLVPLYFSLFIGVIFSLVSFVFLLLVILQKYLGLNLPGWSAIMVAILFLGGMILFTLGILGIYIGNIFKQVQGRQKYIIKNFYN